MMSTTLVVPCYNEASRLPVAAYQDFLEANDHLCVLFVDDGSTDGTHAVLEQLCERSAERCELLRLPENQGKAEAVRQGIRRALDSDASLVGFWDSDLAIPLEVTADLAEIFVQRPTTLMVFGSRVRMLGRDVDRDPFRHYAGRLFATVVSLLLDAAVYDTQCGAKLFRSCPPVRKLFEEPFITRWIFDVEILARLKQILSAEEWRNLGNLIYEHPLPSWHDVSGSKVRPQDFLHAPLDLMAIYRSYLAK